MTYEYIQINLTQGLSKNDQYNAFKFPGGELHIKLTEDTIDKLDNLDDAGFIVVHTRLNDSDSIILLALLADVLRRDWTNKIAVFIPYMPYQQADRKFAKGESFSLKVITTFLDSLPISSYTLFDPHSDASPDLLHNAFVVDNTDFIREVIYDITDPLVESNLIILSPDAGAYKKIFGLADRLGFEGGIECANKYRDVTDGELRVRLSLDDFKGADVLIIDDICMGGRTFTELAKLLKDKNVGKLYLAVSHGIFSNGFDELSTYFTKIYTTNSRKEYDEVPSFLHITNIF